MDEGRARVVQEIVEKFDVEDILEIGFLHGKSSAYFGAIQEDRGKGRVVTIDLEKARDFSPSIEEVLSEVGLEHRVIPVFAHRSFTWELARMIASDPRPQFDLCYLDGGKTWDTEGFAFFLIDMLLKPGGLILFDDIYWALAESADYKRNPQKYAHYDEDELNSQSIRLIWEEVVPHLGYTRVELFERYQWGLAQKPLVTAEGGIGRAPVALDSRSTGMERLFWRTGREAKRRLKRLL
jgi:predicted O-methyltransferase YrrM